MTKCEAHAVDHEMHDGLGHEVPDALVDDADVGVHQVPDGLYLSLQLRVHGEGVCWSPLTILHLETET